MATIKVIVAVFLMVSSINASFVGHAVAPVAPVAYARAIPYNVLPFANSVNVYTRTLHAPVLPTYPAYLRTPFAAPVAAPVAPVAKVSSFLPAPFAAPAGFAGIAPAPVGPAFAAAPVAPVAPVAPAFGPAYAPAYAPAVSPVVRTVNPYYPTPLAHGLVPAPINPAYGRSIHAVAPAAYPAAHLHAHAHALPVPHAHLVGK